MAGWGGHKYRAVPSPRMGMQSGRDGTKQLTGGRSKVLEWDGIQKSYNAAEVFCYILVAKSCSRPVLGFVLQF